MTIKGIFASLAFAAALAGSSIVADRLHPGCGRLPAAGEGNAPSPHQWVIRASTAPEREGVKVASIQFAGFEIGQVVLVERPVMHAPEQAAKWCER